MGIDRYVIARYPNAGIGDHLSCLLSSWWYANQTGRKLIIDWRGSRFNKDKSTNGFNALFALPKIVGGVEIIVNNEANNLTPEGPYYWPKWTKDKLCKAAHVPHTKEEIRSMHTLVMSGHDRKEPVVVFNQHLPLPKEKTELRPLLEKIIFEKNAAARAENFLNSFTERKPLVGVHIRHGNGENIGWRSVYWLDGIDLIRQTIRNEKNNIHQSRQTGKFKDSMPESITANKFNSRTERRMYRKIKRIAEKFKFENYKTEPRIILFTDAPHVLANLQKVIPDAIQYRGFSLPYGSGPLHQIAGVATKGASIKHEETIQDMLVELCLLQHCDGLIYMPSQFTLMARSRLEENDMHELHPTLLNKLLVKCGQFMSRL